MTGPNPAKRPRGLGRGLSALLGEVAVPGADAPTRAGDAAARGTRPIPVELIEPGAFQPRRTFSEDALAALAQSIREKGILQPLLVRPHPQRSGLFELIAGERRWRAAQAAGLHEVPALVRAMGDREALEVALIENIQRQDLDPMEEADGYRRLVVEFGHTQEALATVIGKSRSHIANTLRLLGLPERIQQFVSEGTLSAGHARALIGAAAPVRLAEEVVSRGLNVRQTERLAQADKPRRTRPQPAAAPGTQALARELGRTLGLQVELRPAGNGGQLVIRYSSLDQLDEVLRVLRELRHRP